MRFPCFISEVFHVPIFIQDIFLLVIFQVIYIILNEIFKINNWILVWY
jgi:hypothetical protein